MLLRRLRTRLASTTSSRGAQLNARLVAAPGPEEIIALFAAHGRRFDAVNLATAWGRLSRSTAAWAEPRRASLFCGAHGPALAALRAQVVERLDDFRARELANTAYATASLPLEQAAAAALMARLLERVPRHAGRYKPQELANLAWAFARTGVPADDLFALVEREALPALAAFKPLELAQLAWACAKDGAGARPRADALFGGIAREAEGRIEAFDGRALFNLAWAFATTRRADDALFAALARAAAGQLAQLSARELCVLAWALGRSGARQPALLRAIATAVEPHAACLAPKHVVMLLWALARHERAAPPPLCARLARTVEARAAEYTPHELAAVLWACQAAHATLGGARLVAAVAARVAPHVRACEGRTIAMLAHACALGGHARDAAPLFEAVEAEVPARAEALALADLIRIAWALAVAERLPPPLLAALGARVRALGGGALLAEARGTRVQLQQVRLSAAQAGGAADAALGLSATHAAVCADALRAVSCEASPSRLHVRVSVALAALGFAHEREHICAALGYALDLASVGAGGARLALEVNGPDHYLPCGALHPASALKNAHVRGAGWRLLVLRHTDWLGLPSEAAREAFLCELLESAGWPRGAAVSGGGPVHDDAPFVIL